MFSQKGYVSYWSEVVFVIEKVRNTMWRTVILIAKNKSKRVQR